MPIDRNPNMEYDGCIDWRNNMCDFSQETKYNHGSPERTVEIVLANLREERENMANANLNFRYHGFAKYRVRFYIAKAHVENLEDELELLQLKALGLAQEEW